MSHSIFPRIGLWGKTALGLGAFILCIIGLAGGASYLKAREYAEAKALELERSKFALIGHSIETVLANDRANLLTLRDVPPIQGIIHARDANEAAAIELWREQLDTIFKAFAANHPQYLQMIYADESGNELTKVQRNGASIETVPKNELLRRERLPYVIEALKLPAGQIITSNVYLQREHGRIKEPHTAILNFATPVYSADKRARGIILITTSADLLFHEVVSQEGGIRRSISNEQGYFIKHPDASKTFGPDLGFDYGMRNETPDFDEIKKIQDVRTRYDSTQGKMDGYQKIFFDPEDHSHYWLLSVHIPEKLVFAEVDAITHVMLAAGVIIGLLSVSLILWFVSRKIVTPVVRLANAATLMQRGDMSIRVDETSVRDEFRTLYATINSFAVSQQHATERLQQEIELAKEELSETESWNRLILDSAGEGIFGLDLQEQATFVNPAACRMLGYELDALLGRQMHTLIHHSYADGSPYPREQCPMLITVSTGQIHKIIDEVFWRKDGSSFAVAYSSTPIRNKGELVGAVITFNDVTERKQAEEDLRLASLVLQNSSEGVLISDADNQIVSVNPAFSRITGYSLDEVKGRNPRMFQSGRHDRAFYKSMWNEINTTGQWQGEIWDRHKNGDIHANRVTINTIRNGDGSVHRYVKLFSDITEKKLSEELIWKQANFDTLTGLPNRRMFRDRLAQEVKKSDRTNLPLALLLIDLDRFKEVNDTLGHDMGDILLQEAARRFLSCVRESDTVARLGGDEFTFILSELPADIRHVEDIAQKIIDNLSEPFYLGNEIVHVSASIGITLYPNDAGDLETLLKNADQAMYVAKNKGRNRYSYFTQSLQESAQARLRLTNDLRGALSAGQFRVYFQPVVDLSTERIHKAEALIRWQHPERGMVNPVEFIPLAEDSGLINEIGDWVFRESARWAKQWSQKFGDDFQVSVNMSPIQFRAEGKVFAETWLHHLQELQLPGKNIVIEITEGLLLNAESDIIDKLLVFRDAGIQVAIDDFGTGYSSLSYLKKFDIDYLKIDQSFVRNLATDPNDLALSEAIIVMAHKLGLKVIAEGVELEGQRDMLAAAGCDYAQGYLFSKPVPPEQFEALLQREVKQS